MPVDVGGHGEVGRPRRIEGLVQRDDGLAPEVLGQEGQGKEAQATEMDLRTHGAFALEDDDVARPHTFDHRAEALFDQALEKTQVGRPRAFGREDAPDALTVDALDEAVQCVFRQAGHEHDFGLRPARDDPAAETQHFVGGGLAAPVLPASGKVDDGGLHAVKRCMEMENPSERTFSPRRCPRALTLINSGHSVVTVG